MWLNGKVAWPCQRQFEYPESARSVVLGALVRSFTAEDSTWRLQENFEIKPD
jgi:hypothetical protein